MGKSNLSTRFLVLNKWVDISTRELSLFITGPLTFLLSVFVRRVGTRPRNLFVDQTLNTNFSDMFFLCIFCPWNLIALFSKAWAGMPRLLHSGPPGTDTCTEIGANPRFLVGKLCCFCTDPPFHPRLLAVPALHPVLALLSRWVLFSVPAPFNLESISLWFMSLSLLRLEIGKINTVIPKFIAGFHKNFPSLWGQCSQK